jgi:hypothetical protein
MSRIHLTKDDELTRTLAERIRGMWDAYLIADEPAHSGFLSDDFRAVHPDGTVHLGKPTLAEIRAQPIEDYWLRELQAWPVGEEGAIATYTAEVEVRSGRSAERFRYEVGQVWMKRHDVWTSRYYHATPLQT